MLANREKLLPRLCFGGENRLEFMDKFPRMATHWGVWGLLQGGEKPEDLSEQKWEELEVDAICLLQQCLSTDVFHAIHRSHEDKAAEMYKLPFEDVQKIVINEINKIFI